KTLEVRREFAYTGGQQSITLAAGKYKMECWGAQGGTGGYQNTAGGKGGYTKGEISFTGSETIYVYVGQRGGSNNGIYGVGGSFNGGGGGGKGIHNWPGGCAGGGASDIRLEGGTWSATTSLRSRIMVAAGGGGAGTNSTPAAAGGLNGYNCTTKGGSFIYGASQVAGYAFGWGCTGRTCTTAYNCGAEGNGGGGGGYYGGRAYTGQGTNTDAGGSGGSSFISGHNGCNAINSAGSHTGQSIHYSGLYFSNTVMIDGAGYQWTTAKGSYVGMPNLAGTGTMTGNTGHGQVRISPVK
ncbi:MAG: fimbrillin family protein, partial [Odoribacter sp.]|nr:fimbrillin family protein [Odoribacter sp.]